jgi:3-mercaptopropionate dioxygenase
MIDQIARAVREGEVERLGETLASLCETDAFTSDLFLPQRADRYARKLLWRDPQGAFIVVAMTWSVGQGSPLHDHAGLWGAEIVVDGVMSETVFELMERGGDGRYLFRRDRHRVSGKGTVGLIAPPREHHNFSNAGSVVSHSLHVYSGDLTSAQTFIEDTDGWWTSHRVGLCYDG